MCENKPLIIIGGAGHGSVIEACINDNRNRYGDFEWELKGFCNDYDKEVDGYPVLGKLDEIPHLLNKGYWFIWGIHLIGRNYKTTELYDQISIPIDRLATIIHHSAFISDSVVIDPGCLIMCNSYIAPRTHIGESAMLKANTNIGHDVTIGRLCHIAMGANVVSYVSLGECSDMAVSSTALAHITIGNFAMLGASALATHNIPDGEIWAGVPARYIKPMERE